MNFLLIGHSVVDKIIDGEHQSKKPGGIFYSVISFLSQIDLQDKLFLCSNINKENANLFKEAFDLVEKDFIQTVKSIPCVELFFNKAGEREEIYSEIAQKLNLPSKRLDRFDGILINMITGYDLSLPQFKELRKCYNGPIYFDVHTLSRGSDRNLKRIFRPVIGFDEWAQCIDILQANESELKTLSSYLDEKLIIEELFSYGIQQIIITRSERGATVFIKENNSLKQFHKDALQVKTINKVGCGDVFGAVYFYNYIKNKNILLALEQANLFAGTATTYSTVKAFLNLKKDVYKRISKK
jgi:sugar/nucleoside kinase (ribokinase family)